MVYLKILLLMAAIAISCSCPREVLKESIESKKSRTDSNPALALQPLIENQTDSSATFILKATRNKTVDGEYLPSSENFRVEIFSMKGALEWSSNNKVEFLQLVGKVLPVQPGETNTYSIDWDGKRNNGSQLLPDEYLVKMTIPAKPNPYSGQIIMKWSRHGR